MKLERPVISSFSSLFFAVSVLHAPPLSMMVQCPGLIRRPLDMGSVPIVVLRIAADWAMSNLAAAMAEVARSVSQSSRSGKMLIT